MMTICKVYYLTVGVAQLATTVTNSSQRHADACCTMMCIASYGLEIKSIQPGFINTRQTCHHGVPIRNILYGNCNQCLGAGGLMQRCHACDNDEAFQAMIMLSQCDIPKVMVDSRFLHWMIGYPDDEHNPHIDGHIPDITWPVSSHWERIHSSELGMDLMTIAEHKGFPQWREPVQLISA